jgi:tetratricopeptide (TPR) repeat protein
MKILQLTLAAALVLAASSGTVARADEGMSPSPAAVASQATPTTPASAPPSSAPSSAAVASSVPEIGLARVNAAIKLYPNNPAAYIVRGNIYSEKKMWAEAQSDYQQALSLDPHNGAATINLAEVQFRQKQYDQARATFLTAESDPHLGDLASYMVFLSDLYAAHDAAAGQELAVFNAAEDNASYYFGNVAWDLLHKNISGARDYLQSAQAIYTPNKVRLYESNLIESGYLPLKN